MYNGERERLVNRMRKSMRHRREEAGLIKPHHRHRFVLYHALTISLGIALAAGLLTVAGLAGPVRVTQEQQANPMAVQSTFTTGSCGQQGTLPSQVAQGTLPHGALYLICIPVWGWNGDMLVSAHGYTPVSAPLGFQNLVLPDASYLPDLVLGQGYAFATTSYRQNGLSILEGTDDIRELVATFPQVTGNTAAHTYLAGVSEGGLISTLLIDQSPSLFSGGLAACGPIGSFREQINYLGDFRVLFDFFFPDVLPPSPIDVPGEVMTDWESTYIPAIEQALAANPSVTGQLMSTFIQSSGAPSHLHDPSTWGPTTLNLLRYSVFATNDARQKLGGNPFDNTTRVYSGSANDSLLNEKVARFSADSATLEQLGLYETSGQVALPLVTIHTTGDDIVPFWQEQRYLAKEQVSGKGSVTVVPIERYGHCNFSAGEVLGAFNQLVLSSLESSTPAPALIPSPKVLPSAGDTYLVQPGDTLSKVAKRVGTSVEAIARANHIGNPNIILAGQVLYIPAGFSP
jgi:LysM repeat protein